MWLSGTFLYAAAACSSGSSVNSPNDPARGPDDDGKENEAGVSGEADGFSDRLCRGGYCWVLPLPQGNTLNATHAVRADGNVSTFAVGGGGAFMRRRDAGWQVASEPPTDVEFRGVYAVAPDDVWAVGDNGTAAHYDGHALSLVNIPVKSALTGVWASASNDVWAISDGGEILRYDGKAWTKNATVGDTLHGIWGTGPKDIWAVGGTANVGTYAHWDGTEWSINRSSLSGEGLNAVAGSAADDVWAAGNYGRLLHFDGKSWSTVEQKLDAGADILTVHVTQSGDVWVSNTAGNVFSRRHDENSFVKVKSDVAPLGIASSSNDELTFVGKGGAIQRLSKGELVNDVASVSFAVDSRGISGEASRPLLAFGDAEHGIAVVNTTFPTASVRRFDGKTWEELAKLDDTRNVAVAATKDGSSFLLEPDQLTVYSSGESKVLPKWPEVPKSGVPTSSFLAAENRSDVAVFILNGVYDVAFTDNFSRSFLWNGSAWSNIAQPVGQPDERSLLVLGVASGSPQSPWLFGTMNLNDARRPRGWVGRVKNGAIVSANFVAPSNAEETFAPHSLSNDGEDAWLASIRTDLTTYRENGDFGEYDYNVAVFHFSGGAWTRVAIPGTVPSPALKTVRIGAFDGHVVVVMDGAHGSAGNGFESLDNGMTWKPINVPVSGAKSVYVTKTATFIASSDGLVRSK